MHCSTLVYSVINGCNDLNGDILLFVVVAKLVSCQCCCYGDVVVGLVVMFGFFGIYRITINIFIIIMVIITFNDLADQDKCLPQPLL